MDKGVLNELTIEQKVKLIRCIENGESCRSAAKKFNVSKSTASNIFKRRDYLLAQYEENQSINRCRKLRKTENDEINNAVWLRSINDPISGPMIKAAALEFNDLFNKNYSDRLTYFQASDGWLRCFKQKT